MSLSLCVSLTLTHSLTHTHTHTHSLSVSLSLTHTLSVSVSHTHTLCLSVSLSLCVSVSHLLTHSLTHTHTHTHRQQARHRLRLCFCVSEMLKSMCPDESTHSCSHRISREDFTRSLQVHKPLSLTTPVHNPSASKYVDVILILGAYIILRFSLLYITHTAFTVFIFLPFNLS